MTVRKITLCAWVFIGFLGMAAVGHAQSSEGSTSADKVRQETKELLQALKSYSSDQRDLAIQKSKEALDKMDKRIDELESHIDESWDEMDKNARDKARSSLKTLKNKRSQVAEWYESLKSGSADAWEHIKQGFSDAYSGLNQAWEKSKKEFDPEKDK